MTHDPREALKRADTDFEFIRETLVHCLNEPERTAFWKAVSARDRCREALSAAPGEPVTLGDLPTVPDDDADFTPDLARKIILKYQEMICALTASAPGEQQPWRVEIKYGPEGETNYAWVYDHNNEMVCTAKTHHAKQIVERVTSPPPAAGWNEAIEACKAIAQDHVEDIVKHSLAGEWVAKGILGRIESLRREAPAPEWVAIAGPINIDPEVLQKDALLDRPDAGGGVREALSDWSDLPKDIYVIGAQRVDAVGFDVQCCSVPMVTVPEVRYVRADMIAALSTPSDAVNESAEVKHG